MATALSGLLNTYPSSKAIRRARLINLTLVIALLFTIILTLGSGAALAQATTSQFASGVTTPQGGLILSGSAINPVTGKPFRHLWTADATNGLCRLDPDVDTPGLRLPINPATCLSTVAGAAFNASQLTFDPATNTIYAVDGGGKIGIFVLHFLPDGDSGHGLMDQVNQSILAATPVGANVISGCGIATDQPNATSLGPDGNLYVGFRRDGSIMRIISPTTNPLPCLNVQPNVMITGDRLTSQMAWVGHTLFLNNSRAASLLNFADQCLTPPNGNTICTGFQSTSLITAAPTTLVSDQTGVQLTGADVYFGGVTLSAITGLVQNQFVGLTGGTPQDNFGGPNAFFSNISALAVDNSDPSGPVVYVGDDPTNAAIPGQGRWWQVLSAPPAPAPPSAPLNVTASAGDARATVSWTAPVNHQPVTSYTVRNSSASNGLVVADVNVAAQPGTTVVPTTASVTGLTNGVTYVFEVLASNAQGSGPLSAASNPVTPQAPTVPGQPIIVASPGNASATVAWTAPANGGSPITGYTVTAFIGGVPAGITVPVGGGVTTVVVNGLTNGVAYTFTVHATNVIGNGPESAPSAPVTPSAVTVPGAPTGVAVLPGNAQVTVFWIAPASDGGSPITSYTVTTLNGGLPVGAPVTVAGTSAVIGGLVNGTTYTFTVHATNVAGNGPESVPSLPATPSLPPPDMAITMTAAQANVIAGQNAVYTLQVSNLGPSTAQAVTVTDTATGATVSSVTTSQGACTIAGGTTINCNLGAMANGANVTITVTLKPSAQTVNQATVQSAGDPNPANNTASVTTAFIPLDQTTDVQLVGSAQNGGPAVTGTDTFTWQIKNAQTLAANTVHFSSTLAPGMVFQGVSSTLGATCSAPAPGTATFTCDLATLNGSQTMIVTVNVSFNATGTMSTTGSVKFQGFDNNPANNNASITVGVK